jgi:hypothetical protein
MQLLKFLHFNMTFIEDPFTSNTLLEAVLPPLEALLEVFFCEVLQYINYSSLNVVYYLKMMPSWVVLDMWEEKKVTWEQIWGMLWLQNHCNVLGCQTPSQTTHCDREYCHDTEAKCQQCLFECTEHFSQLSKHFWVPVQP